MAHAVASMGFEARPMSEAQRRNDETVDKAG
jgi:hypothetical protein